MRSADRHRNRVPAATERRCCPARAARTRQRARSALPRSGERSTDPARCAPAAVIDRGPRARSGRRRAPIGGAHSWALVADRDKAPSGRLPAGAGDIAALRYQSQRVVEQVRDGLPQRVMVADDDHVGSEVSKDADRSASARERNSSSVREPDPLGRIAGLDLRSAAAMRFTGRSARPDRYQPTPRLTRNSPPRSTADSDAARRASACSPLPRCPGRWLPRPRASRCASRGRCAGTPV